jgi:hypothetical protein
MSATPHPMAPPRSFVLIGADGQPFHSPVAGTLGGNRRSKVFGRFDCRIAARYLAKGTYQKSRVFFADEPTALMAGYRPCKGCMVQSRRTGQGKTPFAHKSSP